MNKTQARICLLCVAFCWSIEIIIFNCLPDNVTPIATTSITFLVGGLLLLMSFFSRIHKGLKQDRRKQLARCLFLSVLNGSYNTLLQTGIRNFEVLSGSFMMALTPVVLPLILLARRERVDSKTWLSTTIILLGFLVAVSGELTVQDLPAIGLVLLGSLLRSYYFVKLNQYAHEHDPIILSTFICLFGGVLFYFIWMSVQPATFFTIPWSSVTVASLAIYSYFVIALTISLNVFAQRRASAADATIIFSLEIALSVIWGTILPADIITPIILTPQVVIGVLCIVAGNCVELLSDQMSARLKRRAEA